jgi:alpha-glucosidase
MKRSAAQELIERTVGVMRYRWLAVVVAALCSGCMFPNKKKTEEKDTEIPRAERTILKLRSPEDTVQIGLFLLSLEGEAGYPEGRRLYYTVEVGDGTDYTKVIPYSPLGIIRADAKFTNNLVMETLGDEEAIDETYDMPTGKRSHCRNRANGRSATFRNPAGGRLRLDVRAYDDGVAFRYAFPEEDGEEYTVTKEVTGFRIPEGSRAWMQPYDKPGPGRPAYERAWLGDIEAGTAASEIVPPEDETPAAGWALPALFETESGHWILLAESDVTGAYCGSHLADEAPDSVYRIAFPGEDEAEGIGAAEPTSTLPWTMPWRIIAVGDTLAPIVETTLPADLATPSAIEDTGWIRPGRSSWNGWSYDAQPVDYEEVLPFVDLAAEMGWEYSLVDAGWDQMENGTWQDLQAYAADKEVALFLFYNSGGDHNTNDETPRDRMDDPGRRREELEAISEAGIKGITLDFFASDKQWMMQYYSDILEDAAAFGLLVGVRGSTVPRGWQRTYPNLMTAEAVKGAEYYRVDRNFAREQPAQNTILPFTRNAVASMDFTPVTFTDAEYAHRTTFAHELALSVIFESGISHFADRPEGYEALPEGPKRFLKEVPSAWDDTRYIEGEPGKWVVLARRKGDTWYAAGISGEEDPREVTLDLSSIGSGTFEMSLNADGDSDDTFDETVRQVTKDDTIGIIMRPFGGFAASFSPRQRPVATSPCIIEETGGSRRSRVPWR